HRNGRSDCNRHDEQRARTPNPGHRTLPVEMRPHGADRMIDGARSNFQKTGLEAPLRKPICERHTVAKMRVASVLAEIVGAFALLAALARGIAGLGSYGLYEANLISADTGANLIL